MDFRPKDIFFGTLAVTTVLVMDIALLFVLDPFIVILTPIWLWGFIQVILFLLLFFFLMGPAYTTFLRLICPINNIKTSVNDNRKEITVWRQLVFSYELTILPMNYLVPDILKAQVYSLYGLKYKKGALVGGVIIEPYMVEIGHNSQVGSLGLVAAHAIKGEELTLAKIIIGDNVLIGARAIVWAGCEIGDNSVLAPNAVMKPFTKIPPNELWGGIPAKKIKDIEVSKEMKEYKI